jgi:integrase
MPKKIGQIIKIKNGVWRVRIQQRNGTKKSISHTCKSREKAEEKLAELIAQIKLAKSLPVSDVKTFDNLFDDYLEIMKPKLRQQTLELYARYLRLHLRPKFGKMDVRDLTSREIEKHYASLQSTLSGITISQIHVLFKTCLTTARRWKWITENPMDEVSMPNKESKPINPKRKPQVKQVLTVDEVERFLASCDTLRKKTLWLFFAYTGARAQEVFGAKWKYIDFENRTFNVQEVLVRMKGVFKFDAPKTAKSRRLIPLPGDLIEMLKKHRVEQLEYRLKMGSKWIDNDLVFPTHRGLPRRLSNMPEMCGIIAKAAGITKSVTPHIFRHSFATLARRNGVDLDDIGKFLGHSNINITSRYYSHVDLNDKRKTSEVVSSLFNGVGKVSK